MKLFKNIYLKKHKTNNDESNKITITYPIISKHNETTSLDIRSLPDFTNKRGYFFTNISYVWNNPVDNSYEVKSIIKCIPDKYRGYRLEYDSNTGYVFADVRGEKILIHPILNKY